MGRIAGRYAPLLALAALQLAVLALAPASGDGRTAVVTGPASEAVGIPLGDAPTGAGTATGAGTETVAAGGGGGTPAPGSAASSGSSATGSGGAGPGRASATTAF